MNGKYTFKRHSFGQRTVSAVLSAVLAATSLSCLSAVTGFAADDTNASEYGLMENIQDGTILHCFDWKYSDIKAELPNIAAAGFTSVQTSPAQPGGNHDPNASTGIWWWLYQPLSFSIGTNYLGTKEELQELCTEADKYGIKIIVDIVANHFAGDHTYIQEDLKDSKYWRETKNDDYWNSVTDKRYKTTHKDLGMPDIVSEDAYVQQCVKNYIQELKSVGVDGLRWDTLKHIQVPSEDCAFFTEVLDPDMYNYGESLGDPGGNDDDENRALMKEYTGLMSVTDDVYGNQLRRGFASGNLVSTIGNWAYRGVSADKLVYWGESHDTWANDEKGTGGDYYSYSNLTDQNIVDRVYAVTASRAGATSLYFSRPSAVKKDEILAGVKGSTHFTSPEVAEVNKFHNAFSGQTEYCSVSDNLYYTERGTKGVVLVNGKGGSASVSVTAHKMADGTYTDHVSGSTFTVSGGKISGTIGSTGIAVVYKTGDTKADEFKADKLYLAAGKWDKDGAAFTVDLYNSNTKTETSLEMTASSEDGTYQAVLPSGSSWTSVKFQRISADGTKVWNYTDESFPGSNNRYTISSDITDWSGNIGAWDTCTICDHVYGAPVWTWNGTSSAAATFTCTNDCGTSKTVSAAITRTTGNTTVTYTASVTFNGQTYTDSKTVEKTDSALLYLVPSTYWKEADAQFALYTFNSSTNQWTDMPKSSDDLYFVEVPDGNWTGMIFVRMNPARTENRWNTSGESGSTKPVWGQTVNLSLPSGNNNCFTVEENVWTDVTGTWSKYTPAQHTHTYGSPVWSWADDNSSASAAFTCTGCSDGTETLDGTVSVSLGDGVCTYTAAVTKDGTEYTDTKTVNDVTDTLLSKCWAYQRLADDDQKELYRRLLTFARSVVRGEQTSSVFTYTPDFKTTWTSDELGLGSTASFNDTSNAVKAKINALFPYSNKEDMTAVVNALLADCPYEFYWFDKTHGYSYGSTSCSLSGSGTAGAWTVSVTPEPSFSVTMQTSLNYQNGTTTSINTAKINEVKNAVPLSAQTIIDKYKNVSDYEKLEGYAKELCAAVDYNDEAAAGNVSDYDADPWQIVYVFDNDDSTKVVCEGYSKAFKYLCDLTSFSSSSIKCYLVTGTLSSGNNDGGGHMWNIVTMEDGKNYLVDVTNSDEGTNREYHAFFLKGWNPYSQGWYKVSSRNSSNDVLYYIYDDETEALWSDEILTLSTTDYEEAPFLVAASLTLTGDISVNLYMSASKEFEDSGAYMLIKGPNDKEAVKYLLSELEKKNGCYIARCKVNAAQMGEDVSFELYNGSGVKQTLLNSNKTQTFDTFTYSVNTYIEKVKDNDDLLGKTAKAMQNYGAWARQYLISANKISETSEIAEPIAITDVNSSDLEEYKTVKSSGFSVPDLNMSLLVESETSIRVYYTGDKIDAAVSSSGKNVDFVNGTKDGYNYIEIPNISAQDIDKTFTISFGDKGTLNVSALSYAYAALKAHEDDDSYTDICNTVRALFKYNQAAEEFFS